MQMIAFWFREPDHTICYQAIVVLNVEFLHFVLFFLDMETTKLPSDSQATKDGNNQIEKITGSFIKNTIHSEINKTTTKDLATTLTPGLGGEPNIQRLPEQLNGGNQTDRLNGGNQTDAFPEVRNCSGEGAFPGFQ